MILNRPLHFLITHDLPMAMPKKISILLFVLHLSSAEALIAQKYITSLGARLGEETGPVMCNFLFYIRRKSNIYKPINIYYF